MKAPGILTALVAVLLLTVAACGGGDDDSSSTFEPPRSSSGDDRALSPTATSINDDSAGTSDASAQGGTVTIGDQTWTVVPSDQCDTKKIGTVPIVSIAGHAKEDDSIEIVVKLDPRNIGFLLTVMGAGGDPSWSAVSDAFTVEAGGNQISGSGTFSNGTDMVEGSFEVTC